MATSLARTFGTVPVSKFFLTDELRELRAPEARLALLRRKKELTRLRRGLYLVTPQEGGQEYSRELIANHLYGPSYVSFESILSAEGLIPERVVEVRSACMGRSRSFTNETGRYTFTHLPLPYYAVGTRSVRTPGGLYYLAATPEKALCDLIVTTAHLRLQSERALRAYLDEDLRLDDELLAGMNPYIVREAATTAHKKNRILHLLAQFLETASGRKC